MDPVSAPDRPAVHFEESAMVNISKTEQKKHELRYFPEWVSGREGYAERIKEAFHKYLIDRSLKITRQRETVLDYLLKLNHHVTQSEIYEYLRGKHIGKVTIFRMIKLLEECKLIGSVPTSQGVLAYEVNLDRSPHDHLICIKCGSVLDVRWPGMNKLEETGCRQQNFKPLWHRHETFGYCDRCNPSYG